MLTPEDVRRDYFGPRRKGDALVFGWHARGWSYPRRSYHLIYLVSERRFNLVATEQPARRKHSVIVPHSEEVALFRSLLPPAQLARCLAASLKESTR